MTVERDGAYLIFRRDGVEFYDTAIPAQADVGRLIRHMSEKRWFTDELKRETVRLVMEWWGDGDA